jgi:hypothetical protein
MGERFGEPIRLGTWFVFVTIAIEESIPGLSLPKVGV